MGPAASSDTSAPSSASDELAVRNVVALAARHADGDDVDAYVALFTPDAVWDLPGAPRHGHDDIRAGSLERRRAGRVGPGSHTRHVVTTVAVVVEHDRAVADSTWLYYVDTHERPTVASMGTYRDELTRTAAGWKLARRTITID